MEVVGAYATQAGGMEHTKQHAITENPSHANQFFKGFFAAQRLLLRDRLRQELDWTA